MMDDEVSNEAEGTYEQFALLATASLAAKPSLAISAEDVEDPTTQVSAADAEPEGLSDEGAPSPDASAADTHADEATEKTS